MSPHLYKERKGGPATTRNLFIGGGIGASEGKNVSWGPIYPGVHTSPSDLDNVLAGGSISVGYNSLQLVGVQGTGNLSGNYWGPTVGIPGGGATATYSFGVNLDKLSEFLQEHF